MPLALPDQQHVGFAPAGDSRALVEEFFRSRVAVEGSIPAALAEAALFVEQVLALPLGDAEINAGNLGTVEGMQAFVASRVRGA